MAEKTDLQLRLEEVMTALGWTEADLIERSGESRSLVGQWLGKASRPVKTLGARAALRLQATTGYAALWLAVGEGAKMAASGGPPDDDGARALLNIYSRLDAVGRARLLSYADSLTAPVGNRRAG